MVCISCRNNPTSETAALLQRLVQLLEGGDPLDSPPCSPTVPGASASRGSGAASGRVVLIRQEAEYFTIQDGQQVCRLRAIKGLFWISFLVLHPGEFVAARDLRAIVDGIDPRLCVASPKRIEGCGWRRSVQPRLGLVLDPIAAQELKRRIEDLRTEAEEARLCGQPERALRAREERERIEDELLGNRRWPSVDDNDRTAVTKGIRKAIQKIGCNLSVLGHHLSKHVRTGGWCVYTPDVEHPISWRN